MSALLFEKDNVDWDKSYCGRAWLGVLFIHSQAFTNQMNKPVVMLFSMMASFSYISMKELSIHVLNHDRKEHALPYPSTYWYYNIMVVFQTFYYIMYSILFLGIAKLEYGRRRNFLNQLSNSLELDFETKDDTTIKFPTINFCDERSLATWIEARRLSFALGARYVQRIHCFVLIFLIMAMFSLGGFLAYLGHYIPHGTLNIEHKVSLGIFTLLFNAYSLMILLPAS